MIKSSKHNISNITNQAKLDSLDNLFIDYKHDLNIYIGYIIKGTLPLKNNLSSKLLPQKNIKHSRYKQIIYKHASEIIRSQIKRAKQKRFNKYKKIYKYYITNHPNSKFTLKKFKELNLNNIIYTKYFTLPNIQNLSINLDERVFNIKEGNYYDNFVKIILPYFNDKGTKALKINIPLKQHKHSNKLFNQGYNLRNNIQIKNIKGKYYITLIWEKEDTIKRTKGSSMGIDLGVNKLMVTSDGQFIGTEMKELYKKIVSKNRGSNSYKRTLEERTNLINYYIKQLNLDGIKTLYIEDLKNVKYKSSFEEKIKKNKVKFTKKQQGEFNDINAYWIYPHVMDRLNEICEANGISLVKVSPAYTSQTCPICDTVDGESRKGEIFECVSCKYKNDADYNASINIYNKGAYSPFDKENILVV